MKIANRELQKAVEAWKKRYGGRDIALKLLEAVLNHYRPKQPYPSEIDTRVLVEKIWETRLRAFTGVAKEAAYVKCRDSFWVHKQFLNDSFQMMYKERLIPHPMRLTESNIFELGDSPISAYKAIKALARQLNNTDWIVKKYDCIIDLLPDDGASARVTKLTIVEPVRPGRHDFKHEIFTEGEVIVEAVQPGKLGGIVSEPDQFRVVQDFGADLVVGKDCEFTLKYVMLNAFLQPKMFWSHKIDTLTFGVVSTRIIFPPKRPPRHVVCLTKQGPNHTWGNDVLLPIGRDASGRATVCYETINPPYMSEFRIAWEW